MRLGYIIIYVEDVGQTVDFYKKAFDLKPRFIHESGAYTEMETGGTALAFVNEEMMHASHPFRPNRKGADAAGIEITFVTDNVQHQFDKAVKMGAEAVVKPANKPWGQTVSYVKDLNGCLVEICSPMS